MAVIRCQIGTTAHLHRESRLIVSGMRTLPGELSFPDGVNAIGVIIRPEGPIVFLVRRMTASPTPRLTERRSSMRGLVTFRAN
jgi:hypothetical protein